MVKKSVLCLFVLTLACSTLFAADHKPLVSGPATHVIAGTQHQAPVSKSVHLIYSNLGPVGNQYQLNGYLVLGASSPSFGESQFVGVPFTVKTAAKLAGIKVPAQYYNLGDGGTNEIQYCLYSDASGVAGPPTNVGTQIGNCKTADNLPDFGTTGTLTVFNFESQNLALAAGTSYWIVAQENGTTGVAAEMVWDWANNAITSVDDAGSGWVELPASEQGAMAVYSF